jgi:hypothetical protein
VHVDLLRGPHEMDRIGRKGCLRRLVSQGEAPLRATFA